MHARKKVSDGRSGTKIMAALSSWRRNSSRHREAVFEMAAGPDGA